MPGNELPILKRGQPLPASHYEQVTRAANGVRSVTGDKQYIAADFRHGHLAIRWVGPTVTGAGSSIQRFKVVSMFPTYMACVTWDGETAGQENVHVARSWLGQADYPEGQEIYAAQPRGGTALVDHLEKPISWIDITPVPYAVPCVIEEIHADHLVVHPWGQSEQWLVAKPRLLQQNINNYSTLSLMESVDAQTVEVYDGENTGIWKIAPAYAVDDVIYVAFWRLTGVEVEGVNLTLQDTNEDARAWVEVLED